MTTITRKIAEFASKLSYDQLPEVVVAKAKATLLHDLAVALAGTSLTAHLSDYAPTCELDPEVSARRWGSGERASIENAAFVNAATMHARTQDDTHFPSLTHTGSTTLPALIATGEALDADGSELLTAMVAGYEAATAIGAGVASVTTSRGFRATALYGPFGSATAVGRLHRMTPDQLVSTLGLTAAFVGGTNQTWVAGTQEWMFEVGMASRHGITAAHLARLGATGAEDALEGSHGFFAAFAGDGSGHQDRAEKLGEEWNILGVTYKPFPVCAINQIPVKVLIDMATQHDLRPDEVETMRVHLSPGEAAYPGTDCIGPFTDVGASLMSAQFCLAIALQERHVTLPDLRRFDEQSILELTRRVEVVPDEEMTPLSTRLEVDLQDGTTLTGSYESTPDTFDWTHEEVAALARQLVPESALNEDRTEALISITAEMEQHTSRELVDVLAG